MRCVQFRHARPSLALFPRAVDAAHLPLQHLSPSPHQTHPIKHAPISRDFAQNLIRISGKTQRQECKWVLTRLSVSAPQLSIFILLQLYFCSATETSECKIEHFVLKLFRGLRGGFVKSLLLFTSQKHTPYFINTESQTCILAKPLISPTEIDHKGNWSDAT